MKIFVTGRPGSGKTTTLLKCFDYLSKKYKVGGILTLEVREFGKRIGFEVLDVYSKKREIFASIYYKTNKKVGKYGVEIEKFDKIFLNAIEFSIKECQIIIIDEIGKMEFLSNNFVIFLEKILNSDKILIASLHLNFVDKFKNYGKIYYLDFGKSDIISKEICSEVEKYLESKN